MMIQPGSRGYREEFDMIERRFEDVEEEWTALRG